MESDARFLSFEKDILSNSNNLEYFLREELKDR